MMPTRKTRRRIAYWSASLITVVVARTLFLPDLGQQSSALLMIIVPVLGAVIMTFITGETYSDHSTRKHGGDK